MRERTDSTAVSINNVLATKTDPSSLRFESNMRALADLVAQVRNEEEKIREGGGPKAIESQHAKSRLTARERDQFTETQRIAVAQTVPIERPNLDK